MNLRGCTKTVGYGPASMGNFSVAFDVLGVGLTNPGDRVIAERTTTAQKVIITSISGDGGKLTTAPLENTAGVATIALLKATHAQFGANLTIEKGIQLDSGLGSSAASATAALVAVNALLDDPLAKEDLIPFAIAAEQVACGAAHADNAAPSLLGGLVLIASYEPLRVYKLPITSSFWIATATPNIEVPTREARAVLPKEIPLALSSKQLGFFGGSLVGLINDDPLLIEEHLHDLLVEPYRAQFIPEFERHREAALDAGALAFGIGGAGPTVFGVTRSENEAAKVAATLKESFARSNFNAFTATSSINSEGATVENLS